MQSPPNKRIVNGTAFEFSPVGRSPKLYEFMKRGSKIY
uniref:Uncharacterized protein n=1 Tax=Arundo donax TaxID=35708 RepID=A0A0A8ZCR4_ARUDO